VLLQPEPGLDGLRVFAVVGAGAGVWPAWVATSQRAAGNAEYMARSSFGGFRI
jgi:hypothetical protein